MSDTALREAADSRLSKYRPFPGLRPFAFADREFFFGREAESFELYRRLDRSRFIAVVGSSGDGKSSLVRAGLHRLIAMENSEPTGRTWQWVEMHPGDAPIGNLAAALAELAPKTGDPEADAGRRERFAFMLRQSRFGLCDVVAGLGNLGGVSVLIFVDQFEELFRYAGYNLFVGAGQQRDRAAEAASREEAIQFVQLLLQASREPAISVHVLLTMRSDFIGDCARFHGLPEAVSASQFLVPALTRDQREEAIRKPIKNAGGTIEAALVERLLNDSGDEFDELPVLQHGLARLWEEAQRVSPDGRPRLTLKLYLAPSIGGLEHALSRHADHIMAGLPTDDEKVVEQVFRALSELDRGRPTRRALPFAHLLTETGVEEAALRRVLDRFRSEDCSFILPSPSGTPVLTENTRIDVGHEALLRRWEKISAPPSEEVDGADGRGGWMWQEESDGRFYRAMLALFQGGKEFQRPTLPLDQVERRWAWWNERPRTEEWAERYGGHIDRVRRLFDDSRAAVEAQRERDEAQQRAMAAAEARTERLRKWTWGLVAFAGAVSIAAVILYRLAVQDKEITEAQFAASQLEASLRAEQLESLQSRLETQSHPETIQSPPITPVSNPDRPAATNTPAPPPAPAVPAQTTAESASPAPAAPAPAAAPVAAPPTAPQTTAESASPAPATRAPAAAPVAAPSTAPQSIAESASPVSATAAPAAVPAAAPPTSRQTIAESASTAPAMPAPVAAPPSSPQASNMPTPAAPAAQPDRARLQAEQETAAVARDEMARRESTQARRRVSSVELCGRPVNYVIDSTGVPERYQPFLGVWSGASWTPRICGGLIVEYARSDGAARISYVYGPNGPASKFPWNIQHQPAMIEKGELSFEDQDGGEFVFMLTDSDTLFARFTSARGGKLSAVLKRDPDSVP